MVDLIKEKGGKAFLTDTNTLYVGTRSNAVDHLETAILNGFDFSVVGVPLIIADGLKGKDYISIPVKLKHFQEVKIASTACLSDFILTVSHFKGANLHGFGGALKNLGMGFGSRAGKLQQHSDVLPYVEENKCKRCRKCITVCPADAITVENKAKILEEICIGCAECSVTCPHQAIVMEWKSDLTKIQEKTVEYAAGALYGKADKVGFITFITNVSPVCDCFGWNDVPIVGDIGILASKDPVAIDQAALDLVNHAPGNPESQLGEKYTEKDRFKALYPSVDATIQLVYAEKIGLGSRNYKLIDLN